MQTEPIITLEIDQDGNVLVEVSGVQGPSCQALTKELEEALGQVTGKKLKPECQQVNLAAGNKQQQTLGGSL